MPSARKKASRARTSRRTQGQGYPQVPGHAPGQGQGTAPGLEQAGGAVGTMTVPEQATGVAWQGGAGQDGTTVHAGTGPARTTGRAQAGGKIPLATIKVPEPLARQLRFIAANRPQKTTLSALSEELMAASLSREMARTNKFIEKQQKAAQRGQGGDGAADR